MANSLIISAVLLLPLLGAVLTFFLAKVKDVYAKYFAVAYSVFIFLLSIVALIMYESSETVLSGAGMSFKLVDEIVWIKELGIKYSVGVDGLSLPLVILSTFVMMCAMIASWDREDRVGTYFSLMLMLETGLLGTFVFLDMFFFFIAWEVVLVPMFFLIGIWGGERREYAAIYFFIYTHVASLILLLGILGIYILQGVGGSFGYIAAAQAMQGSQEAVRVILFVFLFFGFIVKIPSAPFHTWLPLAHVEAPTAGSMVLAGLLLKMGGYGVIRFNLVFFPDLFKDFAAIIAVIGLISLFWGAFVALQQVDLKRMVAYSSIAHMGMVLLGTAATAATGRPEGVIGAQVMMLAHGVISPMLFNLSGIMQHSAGTRIIASLRGVTQKFRSYAALLVFASFASLGLPSLFGFISEFYAFLGLFRWNQSSIGIEFPLFAFIAIFGVVVTVGFYLWMLQRVVWGSPTETIEKAHSIHRWEYISPALLLIPIVLFGVFPGPLISFMQATFEAFAGLV